MCLEKCFFILLPPQPALLLDQGTIYDDGYKQNITVAIRYHFYLLNFLNFLCIWDQLNHYCPSDGRGKDLYVYNEQRGELYCNQKLQKYLRSKVLIKKYNYSFQFSQSLTNIVGKASIKWLPADDYYFLHCWMTDNNNNNNNNNNISECRLYWIRRYILSQTSLLVTKFIIKSIYVKFIAYSALLFFRSTPSSTR